MRVLDIPHLNKTLTLMLPLIGPNYHDKVMEEIDSKKFCRPTDQEIISLISFSIKNPKETFNAEVIKIFKEDYFWTATESLSFSEGVFVYDNVDGKMPQDSKELIRLFNSRDKRVRFVKPEFKTGKMLISDFLKNPYAIAHLGEEMLEITEKVARFCDTKEIYLYGLDKSAKDTKRLTSIDFGWYNDGLYFDGNCRIRNDCEGYAPMIFK